MNFKDHKCKTMQGDGIVHYDPKNGLHFILWCQHCGKNVPESINIKEIDELSDLVSKQSKQIEALKASGCEFCRGCDRCES